MFLWFVTGHGQPSIVFGLGQQDVVSGMVYMVLTLAILHILIQLAIGQVLPQVALPRPRTAHVAVANGLQIVMFGGKDAQGNLLGTLLALVF
jgi:hypothetical protein